MISKNRVESTELQILRFLVKRMELSEKEVNYYRNLEQGYKGECIFDRWLDKLPDHFIVLNDLLLEQNNTLFQLDSLLIIGNKLYLFEVKNFQGDFVIEDERWYTRAGNEIKDPLIQLHRSESLLRQLLQSLRLNFSIESYLIFIQPHFYLYKLRPDLPIVFSTQLQNFFDALSTNRLQSKSEQYKIIKYLLANHIEESPYTRLPNYYYHQMRKGIICPECNAILLSCAKSFLLCKYCDFTEKVDDGVLRNVQEYKTLFVKQKVTVQSMFDWCDEVVTKRALRRVLVNNFTRSGEGRDAYYY
ncbi:nuclease-related domain-containing protein [Radiobacillus sp. PE A8.2]|uniref:nuclease-related domain-containing protein n=1 Tax=Radiobacillus sp. PE A8.2 TaxID=3380349 RepID=UPI00388D5263